MIDAVSIFIMIGLANWGQHLFQCDDCGRQFLNTVRFFHESLIVIFGWPLQVATEFREWWKPDITKFPGYAGGIHQRKGEPLAEFVARAEKEMREMIAKKESERK